MSILKTCSRPGCETKTLGALCLAHELSGSESNSVTVRRAATTRSQHESAAVPSAKGEGADDYRDPECDADRAGSVRVEAMTSQVDIARGASFVEAQSQDAVEREHQGDDQERRRRRASEPGLACVSGHGHVTDGDRASYVRARS